MAATKSSTKKKTAKKSSSANGTKGSTSRTNPPPGRESAMSPKPDHGEQSYRGRRLLRLRQARNMCERLLEQRDSLARRLDFCGVFRSHFQILERASRIVAVMEVSG